MGQPPWAVTGGEHPQHFPMHPLRTVPVFLLCLFFYLDASMTDWSLFS
ncbi:MAG: hypothetical protein AVDCRST_MAG56-5606 [uncultured Cytophagales bacterium]|uniref:Uncharacterized protein n=1 Tax=uncultured Cytophagales bacterium TaxID=158755 RepID=A0A6J4KDT5_9SPHI|nr:MAG: hypothetical protein AVDCRST_MAG56-5606 [uncultured Cytophagales bacterium]